MSNKKKMMKDALIAIVGMIEAEGSTSLIAMAEKGAEMARIDLMAIESYLMHKYRGKESRNIASDVIMSAFNVVVVMPDDGLDSLLDQVDSGELAPTSLSGETLMPAYYYGMHCHEETVFELEDYLPSNKALGKAMLQAKKERDADIKKQRRTNIRDVSDIIKRFMKGRKHEQ